MNGLKGVFIESIIKNQMIVLINQKDEEIGIEEKIKTHIDGKLHRAFSVLVFNSKGELLIQQRAKSKYHSQGLWSNTICSHPRPKRNIIKEIHKRLKEEMGFVCPVKKLFVFHYKKKFENGLIENELDHVFIGKYDGKVFPNPKEALDYKWVAIKGLKVDIQKNPEKYTYWFKIIIRKLDK